MWNDQEDDELRQPDRRLLHQILDIDICQGMWFYVFSILLLSIEIFLVDLSAFSLRGSGIEK